MTFQSIQMLKGVLMMNRSWFKKTNSIVLVCNSGESGFNSLQMKGR